MVWFKVDDRLHSHPKALATSLAAIGLWTVAGSWSGDHLTDGVVSDQAVSLLSRGAIELADELVAAGLWTRVRGGYRYHEWHANGDGTKRNPTKMEVQDERRKRSDAGRKGGLSSGKARSKPASKGEASASARASPIVEPPSRPVPTASNEAVTPPSGSPPRKRGTRLPDQFPVTAEMRTWAQEHAPTCGQTDHDAFCDYWRGVPGVKGSKLDWTATWRNWMRKEHERRGARASPRKPNTDDRIAEFLGRSQPALPPGGEP